MQTNLTLVNEDGIEYFKKYNINPGTSYDGLINPETRQNDKDFF
jgi:sulfatase maturation enzyme AslB (radical SAM superfamily)